ncbi:hypothetical protein HS048_31005 [Planomonospora sp. ID91781]|uniref:Uncharacterized protein n=3 Tax=Planomonospora TaxID=1998 RepID=A0A171DNY8_9ACTN|nr:MULTISPECIES: hypothetical protein [Planomonospora]MBG0825125.1 hypothetical protein [Planomonospora sp. ID91781]GAT70774.1 hypothetical protein PS9374_06461 [Planomonospora sphaerica]GGK52596.1 hypothetical protein GCM10010126_10150 [Planomonospora parontospora]GII06848.1 hypothetical protein Ppa06_06460 [Planomonospora parontospora subsp. parontospora]
MSEFTAELLARIDEVDAELRLVRQAHDDHAVEVLSGRLDNLLRIAGQHGVEVRHGVGAPAGETA